MIEIFIVFIFYKRRQLEKRFSSKDGFSKRSSSKDGSSEGSVNLSTTHFPTDEFCFPTYLGSASSNATNVEFNFGNPVTALASGNADANGYGSFEFAPPSGYYAICTKNLAEYG